MQLQSVVLRVSSTLQHSSDRILTEPDKACIALTGTQPGFSAECNVLAGTPLLQLRNSGNLVHHLHF